MWEIDTGDQGSLRPKLERHSGPSPWLMRYSFVALHVAMLGTALVWFGWHPSGSGQGMSPSVPARPGPQLALPEPPSSPRPSPFGLPPGPVMAPARPSSPPVPANRLGGGSGGGPAGPHRSKSLREARTNPDPAPARLDGQESVALLESKGLTRGATGFVLANESAATSRLATLRSRASEFNQADMRLAAINQALAFLRELNQAITNLNARISELDAALAQFPATFVRGRWFHGNNNIENDAYETFKAQKIECERVRGAELVPRREMLLADQPGRQQGEAAQDQKRRREVAVAALAEVQEAVSSTKKTYTDLGADPEVKRALAGLGGAALGPSREFLQVERECRDFEESAARLKLTPGR